MTYDYTEIVLEELTSNFQLKIIERWPGSYATHRLRLQHSGYDNIASIDINICHSDITAIINALMRTRDRIEKHCVQASRVPHLHVIDGLKIETVRGPEMVVDAHTTSRPILGHNHIDPVTGEVEFFVEYSPDGPHGELLDAVSSGSSARFTPEEFGMTLEEVSVNRRRAKMGVS